ncbi:MAG: glycosyltransferase [Acidimicrobiales bacterium]
MVDAAGRLVLVANAGGHLTQLYRLASRLPAFGAPPVWVTSETAQSRSILDGEDVVWVPEVAPRDVANVLRCLPQATALARQRPAMAVSTGSGVALGFLPVLAAAGIPCHYVESATRVEGPSLTGRLLRWSPRVRTYSQHRHWSDERWRYPGSVFEGFESARREPAPSTIRRAVVTVGTLEYPFERMVRKVATILPPEAEVVWQVGPARVDDLHIDARRAVPSAELADAIAESDLVIAHAGTGSALAAFEAGHCPVLIPRERAHGEHVDDHQHQTAAYLDELDLAVVRSVDDLTLADLLDAAGRRVVSAGRPRALTLV